MMSAIALVAAVLLAAEQPALVVLEPEAKGASAVEAAAVVTAIARGARELEAFQVVTSADLRAVLGLERQKQLVGLGSESAPIFESLGANHALASSVSKVGSMFQVEVRLLDTHSAKVLAQRSLPPSANLGELTQALAGVSQEVLGPLLANELGTLLVRSTEEGAEVRVDDKLVASTPMSAPLSVARGRHRLELRREGFISRKVSVAIAQGELTVQDVSLVPSADFAEAWRARNSRLRLGAWISTGVAIVSVGLAFSLDRFVAEPTYQNEFKPRAATLALAAAQPDAVGSAEIERECLKDTVACRAQTEGVKTRISGLQTTSAVLLGVGAAAAVAAAYCFISGDDPNRYSRLAAGVAPTAGGAAVVLSGAF
jgi:hypothetical protein